MHISASHYRTRQEIPGWALRHKGCSNWEKLKENEVQCPIIEGLISPGNRTKYSIYRYIKIQKHLIILFTRKEQMQLSWLLVYDVIMCTKTPRNLKRHCSNKSAQGLADSEYKVNSKYPSYFYMLRMNKQKPELL